MEHLREILVEHGVKVKLCKDCNTSHTTVKFALKGVIKTDLSKLIRKRAVEFYGGVYTK